MRETGDEPLMAMTCTAAARVKRPRLECRLPASAGIVLLQGPAGCGKSELLRGLRIDPDTVYFRAGEEHGTFGRFVHGLAETIAPIAPGAQASFPRAWERALQSRSPGMVLAHWLGEHLAGMDGAIVLDDLHDAASDPCIAAFIAALADVRSEHALTIALRTSGELPVALWMATGRMDRPIDEADLRFDDLDVATAAAQFGVPLEPGAIAQILAATRGLPIAVMYALTQLCRDPQAFARAPLPDTFEGIATAIFDRRSGRQRALLFNAALCSRIDDDVLALSGWQDAFEIRTTMVCDAPFMWERDSAGNLRFHDRFRAYLAGRFAACEPAFRSTIARQAVQSLRRAGHVGDALDVATRQGLSTERCALLDEYGFQLLESGEVDVISEALDAGDGSEASPGAKAHALRGYLDAQRGRFDAAEAWFRLGLESANDESTRVTIALYYARELAVRRRDDACAVLQPFADSTTLPRAVLIDVRSSFAQALAAANQLDEARSRTEQVFTMLDADLPPALRARVFARAAYVALECGALELARERASIAAPLAVAQSLYDVAASTYSVLYNIAYRSGDAIASLQYLRRVRAMGVKSGTLRLERYSLLGMYELQAEAGDEAALAALETQLAAVDKHDAGVEIVESFLPARALRVAYSGNFAAAAELLQPTAERYATPQRRALSWAQISVYRAAQGEARRAQHAARSAQHEQEAVDVPTSMSDLTLLTLALAAWAGGDLNQTRTWIERADRTAVERPPRNAALRSVLDALLAGSLESPAVTAAARRALAELRTASFGGMARLIETLPYRRGLAGPSQTVGTVLAQPALPAPALLRFVDDVDASIATLIDQLEIASPLTAEHSRAVSAWCTRIARTLGLGETQVEFVSRCGLVHDIGKMRTPLEILNAPRGLSPVEWSTMKNHAAEGARVVGDIDLLRPFIPIVRGHHERLDGSGYPDGLRLRAIPLAARIVAVADSFNAMIARRPYRAPLAPNAALEELQRNRETQFDPEIVAAMIGVLHFRPTVHSIA